MDIEQLIIVRGFTMSFDSMMIRYGTIGGSVFCVIARHTLMRDGVCRASQERLAYLIGAKRITVNRWIKTFIDDGLLIDTTPDAKNKPHVYALTEEAKELIRIGIIDETAVSESYTENDVTVSESYSGGVSQSYTRKQLNKIQEGSKDSDKTVDEGKNNLNINKPRSGLYEPEQSSEQQPKPAKAKTNRQPKKEPIESALLEHPAVKVWIDTTRATGKFYKLDKLQIDMIIKAVNDDNLDKWKIACQKWGGNKKYMLLVADIISFMENGFKQKWEVERDKRFAQSKGNGNQPRASFLKQERNYPKDQVIAWFTDNRNKLMPPPFDWITPAIYERWIAMGKDGDALMSMTQEQFTQAEEEYAK